MHTSYFTVSSSSALPLISFYPFSANRSRAEHLKLHSISACFPILSLCVVRVVKSAEMARGRPQKGLTRMDAALDAMESLGFPREKVKRFVKDLLKEYGGNQGWRFIEEDSYLQLIEALLRDAEENDQENATGSGNQSKETLLDDVAGATTSAADERPENVAADVVGLSGVVADPIPPEPISSPSGIHHEVGENVILPTKGSWKDILPHQTPEHVEKEMTKVVVNTAEEPKTKPQSQENSAIPASPKRPNILSPPPRRGLPCYGWIDSDDEETPDDFIRLEPAPVVPVSQTPPPAIVSTRPSDGTQNKRTRKTRWDVKPGDP